MHWRCANFGAKLARNTARCASSHWRRAANKKTEGFAGNARLSVIGGVPEGVANGSQLRKCRPPELASGVPRPGDGGDVRSLHPAPQRLPAAAGALRNRPAVPGVRPGGLHRARHRRGLPPPAGRAADHHSGLPGAGPGGLAAAGAGAPGAPRDLVALLSITVLLLTLLVRPLHEGLHVASLVVASMALYLFLPNRLPWMLAGNAYLLVGFVGTSLISASLPPVLIMTSLLLLLFTNLLGWFSITHLKRLKRLQFALLLEERSANAASRRRSSNARPWRHACATWPVPMA